MVANARDKYKVIPVRYICALFGVDNVKEAEPRFVRTSQGRVHAKKMYSQVTGTPFPLVTTYAASNAKFASEAKKYPEFTDNSKLKQIKRGK